MHLSSLDKKMLQVQSRHEVTHLREVEVKHKLSEEQVENEIQRDLYQKLLPELSKIMPVSRYENLGEFTYGIRGYVLSDKDMYSVIKECLEMDERGKQLFLEQICAARENLGDYING